jgi:hypothetical protein
VSVIVMLKFATSGETVAKVARENAATMQSIIEDGRRHGAIHHQFVEDPDDGGAVVLDEWPDAESFHRFFGAQQDIPGIMAKAGVTEPPVVRVYQVLDTPDRF